MAGYNATPGTQYVMEQIGTCSSNISTHPLRKRGCQVRGTQPVPACWHCQQDQTLRRCHAGPPAAALAFPAASQGSLCARTAFYGSLEASDTDRHFSGNFAPQPRCGQCHETCPVFFRYHRKMLPVQSLHANHSLKIPERLPLSICLLPALISDDGCAGRRGVPGAQREYCLIGNCGCSVICS